MKPLTLHQRAALFNAAYPQIPHQHLHVAYDEDRQPFLSGYWFIFGENVSPFYGSYQREYLRRVQLMFPDCHNKREHVHLFSGSLPPGDYTRVGMDGTGQYKADFECDAHKLASFLPFRPSLIMSDPPYVRDGDIAQYKCKHTNRPAVLEQCAMVLAPGGWVVWIDDTLTNFSNKMLRYVGCIAYAQSTGHRFRCVTIFQKPANAK